MAQAGSAALILALLSAAPSMAVTGAGQTNPPAPSDLAREAASGNLPQVSAALLRTQIQQEQDPAKRMELTRRLVALLASGGRYEEALAVGTTADAAKDPQLAYWKGVALLGTGDSASAKDLFSSLMNQGSGIPGISPDQIALGLARALRGTGDPAAALAILEKLPTDSPSAGEASLERASDLLALGRKEECLKVLQGLNSSSEESKAAGAYIRALAAWRAGNVAEAGKLFATVPVLSPWYGPAATLGAALCQSASGSTPKAIDLLEKRLEISADAPLLEDQFLLLDQLYAASAAPDTGLLKKWSEETARPVRARLAAFYQAKGELRLRHAAKAEAVLESLIGNDPDDPLSDRARLLLASSKLQRGLPQEALPWCADRPDAPPGLRARLGYARGLALAATVKPEDAKKAFDAAASLDPSLATNALFNKAVLVATTDRGSLDLSAAAQAIVGMNAGLPSEEMRFQIALDLARRNKGIGVGMLGEVAEQSKDPSVKSRARLAAAELNMKSGRGAAASSDLAKAVRDNSGEPEREEYLEVFLKDTGRKSDAPAVITAARAFLKAHPDSRFVPEVRLKLAEALLSSGDVQAARVEFEQLAFAGMETDLGRRALFLAAQSAARAMDPASMDDSLMLLERVAETGGSDQLVWQARLQQGALKNAQNLPAEALAIYDKILSFKGEKGPDAELRAAALMAKGDTLHQLGAGDPARDREALQSWRQLGDDPSMPLRWRNQALCKSGLVLEKLGEGDAALASYYRAFRNPRQGEPEQLWHDKSAFEAGRLLESRKQWNDAVALYGQILAEGGPRADEAKARLAKLKLENFLWEN